MHSLAPITGCIVVGEPECLAVHAAGRACQLHQLRQHDFDGIGRISFGHDVQRRPTLGVPPPVLNKSGLPPPSFFPQELL